MTRTSFLAAPPLVALCGLPTFASEQGKKTVGYQARFMPGNGGSWFRFDNEPDIEQVSLFLSAEPIAELEQLCESSGTASLWRLERLIARNGPPVFLGFDEGDLGDGGEQGATFNVEKWTPQPTFVVRRLDLSNDAERIFGEPV